MTAPVSNIALVLAEYPVLDPAGTQAQTILKTWWIFAGVTTIAYLGVIGFLAAILIRGRMRRAGNVHADAEYPVRADEDRGAHVTIATLAVVTAVVLVVLLVLDLRANRALAELRDVEDPLRITVTGRQWWWEFRYESGGADKVFTTANELHLPVGRVAELTLRSADVIHSFWAPNLHGKRDLIPGHPTTAWLRADRAGTFDGRCAEFCGHQHAQMRFQVVAQPAEQFEQWCELQRRSAEAPPSAAAVEGRRVFLSATCVMCHSVAGTEARGTVGPDLTHLASRKRIAAGTLPNTRGHLGGWILNPQHTKPGVRMPQNALAPDELQLLLDYLETLK